MKSGKTRRTSAFNPLSAWVDTCGTYGATNTSIILVETSSSALIIAEIDAGVGQTQMSHYTVPFNHTGYLARVAVDVAVGTNKDADIRMWQRQGAYTTSAPFGTKRLIRQWNNIQGHEEIIFEHLPSFPALTDIWFDAIGTATTAVDIDYDIILIKNEPLSGPV